MPADAREVPQIPVARRVSDARRGAAMTAGATRYPHPTKGIAAYVSDPNPRLLGSYRLCADYDPDPASNPLGGAVSVRL